MSKSHIIMKAQPVNASHINDLASYKASPNHHYVKWVTKQCGIQPGWIG